MTGAARDRLAAQTAGALGDGAPADDLWARRRTTRVMAAAGVVSFGIVSGGMTGSASAQEYCVACTEPNQLYRCVIEGARPNGAQSLQLLCLNTLAKEGAHATCSVRRDIGVIDCNGPIKRVELPAAQPSASGGAPAAVVPIPVPLAPPVAAAPASEPKPVAGQGDPKTVEEMLRRAQQKSDRDWEKTNTQIKANNEKIGGFFKKSWDCLSSLFARCGP